MVSKKIIHFLMAGLLGYIGCAPLSIVVQHAEKGDFSHSYKYLGVYCDRANVHIHGWSSDSVSIAVTMDSVIKDNYSFLVDSSGDSLLLIGKHGVRRAESDSVPAVDIAAPYKTDITIRTHGAIVIDSVNGKTDAGTSGDIAYRCTAFRYPANLISSGGAVRLELPADFSGNVDIECNKSSQIRFNSQGFHGEQQFNFVKGTVGDADLPLKIIGEKGVDVQFNPK